MRRDSFVKVFLLSSFILLFPSPLAAVTWDQQAERLQNVSAAFLDGLPMGDPLFSRLSLEGRAIISILPKADPTIGGKSEKVPSSPVHTIPELQFNGRFMESKTLTLGGSAWIGLSLPGAEKLLNLPVKLNQNLYGLNLMLETTFSNNWSFYSPIGYQVTNSKVTGAITAPDAQDEFTAETTFFYIAPGIKIPTLNMWASLMIGRKQTHSKFSIPADGTVFDINDNLSDSSPALVEQLAVGWLHSSGIQLALAELLVPKRVLMPRILVSYQYSFIK